MSSYSIEEGIPRSPRAVTEGIVVRAELAEVRFDLRCESSEPLRNVQWLEESAGLLSRRLVGALPEAVVRVHGLLDQGERSGKLVGGSDTIHRLTGSIEVPFDAHDEVWPRARKVAALADVVARFREERRKHRPAIEGTFGPPQPQIREPERHRAALLQLAADRAREAARVLGDPAEPLHVVQASVPGQVEQRPHGPNEVNVLLALTLRLEVLPRPAASGTSRPSQPGAPHGSP